MFFFTYAKKDFTVIVFIIDIASFLFLENILRSALLPLTYETIVAHLITSLFLIPDSFFFVTN